MLQGREKNCPRWDRREGGSEREGEEEREKRRHNY